MICNTIEVNGDVVIKTINKPYINITKTWFDRYTELSQHNEYLVKVLEIDVDKNAIVMENLGIYYNKEI